MNNLNYNDLFSNKSPLLIKDNHVKNQELEHTLYLENTSIYNILKTNKDIFIKFSTKSSSIPGTSTSNENFSNNIFYYVINIQINIQYIENVNSKKLILLPFNIYKSFYIPLENDFHTIDLKPKINNLIVEKIDKHALYIYINFTPY